MSLAFSRVPAPTKSELISCKPFSWASSESWALSRPRAWKRRPSSGEKESKAFERLKKFDLFFCIPSSLFFLLSSVCCSILLWHDSLAEKPTLKGLFSPSFLLCPSSLSSFILECFFSFTFHFLLSTMLKVGRRPHSFFPSSLLLLLLTKSTTNQTTGWSWTLEELFQF